MPDRKECALPSNSIVIRLGNGTIAVSRPGSVCDRDKRLESVRKERIRCLRREDLDTLDATLGRLGWRVAVFPTVLVTLRYACDSAAFREVLLRAPVTNKRCK